MQTELRKGSHLLGRVTKTEKEAEKVIQGRRESRVKETGAR